MKNVLVTVSISVVNMLSTNLSKESELSEALEVSNLEKSYNLTQQELKTLREAGLAWPSFARVVHFARVSNKEVREILFMRFEDKKSWRRIAEELEISAQKSIALLSDKESYQIFQ
jgi:hypothetical protein